MTTATAARGPTKEECRPGEGSGTLQQAVEHDATFQSVTPIADKSSGTTPAFLGVRGRGVAQTIREHVQECAARRRRVLRHPDLAVRLTQPPLSYSSPDAWPGYVPPAGGYWGAGGAWVKNDSPFRAQLVAIASEAYKRDITETGE